MRRIVANYLHLTLIVLALSFLSVPTGLLALEKPGDELKEVGVSTELGTRVDLDLQFTNSEGNLVKLGSLFTKNRPAVIVPVYYSCPRLCGLVLKGVTKLLNAVPLELGEDYQVITVSFDTSETPKIANKRAKEYISQLDSKQNSAAGWHFLVGDDANVSALMKQIGFNYRPDGGEFAHTAAIMLLTPNGEVSQYFTGISFPASDVRLALIDASRGNIGTAFDHLLLYCFRFDPTKGKYTWAVVNLMRVVGALSILLLGGLVVSLRWRERRARSGKHSRSAV